MPKPILAALLAFVLAVGAAASSQAAPAYPALSGRVVDEAHLLSAEGQAKIAALSAEHEKQTGHQVVVATVKSTDGYDIEQYANGLFRSWGIGQKGKNDGVLILVSLQPKRVRIEVGYGLEGDLTDAQSRLIIENTIAPAFKKGDFDGGLATAAAQVMRTLGGNPTGVGTVPDVAPAQGEEGGGVAIVFFIIFMLLFGRHLWPFLLLGSVLGGGRSGGFGGGGFGGGGFGGGGFSGGGGSSGGGGASGSW